MDMRLDLIINTARSEGDFSLSAIFGKVTFVNNYMHYSKTYIWLIFFAAGQKHCEGVIC